MARKRSRLLDYFVYLFVRTFVCIAQMFPPESALAVGDFVAWVVHAVNRRHRKVAIDNLVHAFPDATPEWRERVVYDTYRHFCSMAMMMVHLPRCFHARSWRKYLDMTEGVRLIEPMLDGRSALLVTGHFGNWELGGYTMGVFGFPSFAVARALDNPWLDDFVKRFRQKTGQTILDKEDCYDDMQRILGGNEGSVAMLGDQDAGRKGMYVDFFGRPASTHKAIALLAIEHGVPLVVLGIPRVDGVKHRLVVGDVIDPREYDGDRDAAKKVTQRFASALEEMVRLYPEQYLWLHRRWKHQPKAKERKAA